MGTSGRLLYDPDKSFTAQKRTVWCHRRLKNESRIGHIFRRTDGKGARLTGVTTCGMVWTCPVCARRIAEQRRDEIERGITAHVQAGGNVYLLSLTAPHERTLSLREFRRLFTKALQRFKNAAAYKAIRARYEHIGSIRSLELTYGIEHGWHLHSHDLYFAKPGLEDDARAIDELKNAWINALIKVGLGEQSKWTWMWEHALDLRGGKAAADYVTAFGHDSHWGLSSEMTRQQAKVGFRNSAEHSTPFQILAWASTGDADACRLWREYAEAMEDARMIYWSPKLKAKLGVDERTDEEIAADDAARPEETNVAQITDDELALVLSRRALGELIEFVCLMPDDHQACVADFLDVLRSRPPSSRGVIRVRRLGERAFTKGGEETARAKQLKDEGRDRFDTVQHDPDSGIIAA